MERISWQNFNAIQIGDTLRYFTGTGVGHVVFVYNVTRNEEDGTVNKIYTYEAASDCIQLKEYTEDQANLEFKFTDSPYDDSSGSYHIFRYKYIDNVIYQRSPYVGVDNDKLLSGYDFDSLVYKPAEGTGQILSPKKGDKCNYLDIEDIILDYYGESTTDTIRIYKDLNLGVTFISTLPDVADKPWNTDIKYFYKGTTSTITGTYAGTYLHNHTYVYENGTWKDDFIDTYSTSSTYDDIITSYLPIINSTGTLTFIPNPNTI